MRARPALATVLLLASPAFAAAQATPGPAAASGAPEDPAVLVIMDSSKSMREQTDGGGTRIDSAKRALRDVVSAVPRDARVGLRVYGGKLANTTRAKGCRDTELRAPVAAGDRDGILRAVDALSPTGFTPIGRSLRESVADFPAGAKRKTIVLVSDGGDNCAPPDPCKVARSVAKQGIDLSIQVIGLQVNQRVRDQLECIARAGGGTYVDADDPDALKTELRAKFARAFRAFVPTGTKVRGGAARRDAAAVGDGQYVDSVNPGEQRWYRFRLEREQRVFVTATPVNSRAFGQGDPLNQAKLELGLLTPAGTETDRFGSTGLSNLDARLGRINAVAAGSDLIGLTDTEDWRRPGVYYARVALGGTRSASAVPVPLELTFDILGPDDQPGAGLRPGPARPDISAPRPAGQGQKGARARADGGSHALTVIGVAAACALLGALAGFAGVNRVRRA